MPLPGVSELEDIVRNLIRRSKVSLYDQGEGLFSLSTQIHRI